MQYQSRISCLAGIALSILCSLPPAYAAPAWPDKPIKVIVPFPAGGQLDVVVRSVADKLAPVLG